MIPDSTRTPQTRDWKLEFSRSFRRVDELLAYCGISEYPDPLVRTNNFSFRVTRFYAALIEKGNPADPLLLQVLPDTQEQHIMPGYHVDAVGDRQATIVPGLIHKYRGRVLLTLTSACAIHCRYCFRRHYPYAENITDISLDGPVMAYLADNPEINEVILSGGDPLMISDEKLSQLITHLNRIPQIRLLRIHSRLLSVLPDRLTESLLASLGRFHGKVILVTHINHANELNDTTRELFLRLQAKGFSLFNQSV